MKRILLLTRIESQAFTALKDCILPLAKDRDWAVHVFALGGMETTAAKLIQAWNPDGCIVYAASGSGLNGNFGRWRKPTVAMNAKCPIQGIATIAHDSRETGRLAAAELASLGMDNFAFLSKASHADDWNDRQEATEQTQHVPTTHHSSLFLLGSGRVVLLFVSYRKLMQMPIGRRIG